MSVIAIKSVVASIYPTEVLLNALTHTTPMTLLCLTSYNSKDYKLDDVTSVITENHLDEYDDVPFFAVEQAKKMAGDNFSLCHLYNNQDEDWGGLMPDSLLFGIDAKAVAELKADLRNNLSLLGLNTTEDAKKLYAMVESGGYGKNIDIELVNVYTELMSQQDDGSERQLIDWEYDLIASIGIDLSNLSIWKARELMFNLKLGVEGQYFSGECYTRIQAPLTDVITAINA